MLNYQLVDETLAEARGSIDKQIQTIAELNRTASKHPYYKYSNMWSREMQNAVRTPPNVLSTAC